MCRRAEDKKKCPELSREQKNGRLFCVSMNEQLGPPKPAQLTALGDTLAEQRQPHLHAKLMDQRQIGHEISSNSG